MHTALLVFGEREGTGKSIFFNAVAKIYGRYSASIDQSAVQSEFNDWASQKLFIICEEVVTNQDRRNLKGALKNYITKETNRINSKGMKERYEENKANYVFLSNEQVPVLLEDKDRRYQAIRFETYSDQDYFRALANEIENGGVEAFYGFLLNYKIENFGPSTRPIETAAYQDLKRMSVDSSTRFLIDWLEGNTSFPVTAAVLEDLYDAYQQWCKASGERPAAKVFFSGRCKSRLDNARVRVNVYTENPNAMISTTRLMQKQVYWPRNEEAEPPKPDELSQGVQLFQCAIYRGREKALKNEPLN